VVIAFEAYSYTVVLDLWIYRCVLITQPIDVKGELKRQKLIKV
jgi:hypothetical protein